MSFLHSFRTIIPAILNYLLCVSLTQWLYFLSEHGVISAGFLSLCSTPLPPRWLPTLPGEVDGSLSGFSCLHWAALPVCKGREAGPSVLLLDTSPNHTQRSFTGDGDLSFHLPYTPGNNRGHVCSERFRRSSCNSDWGPHCTPAVDQRGITAEEERKTGGSLRSIVGWGWSSAGVSTMHVCTTPLCVSSLGKLKQAPH